MEKLAELVGRQLATGKGGGREGERERGGELLHSNSGLSTNLYSATSNAQSAQGLLPKNCDRYFPANSTRYPLVGTATLELGYAPLNEQICQFASVSLANGCDRVQLLPLFLLPGVHVKEDIPTEVALAQECLGEAVMLSSRPHIGTHPNLARLLASHWVTLETDAKILLSHGSRRVGGNESVEAVAKQLGGAAAYWSVQPTLEEQIKGWAAEGHKQIAILPYFLFAGGITDAIAQQVNSLQAQFPSVQLSLGEPIGASAKLASLILDLIER
jgi:sirohydrochlorin cobaltochelatase